ncbi:MAG TPA: hypothetical protein VFD70_20390 [Anaerolineae bacterium]|nr:hypothetical protein [Anaerolineae bacterium]
MGLEPERDRFFQYATFIVLGTTLVVCGCFALLFLNPRVNPIAAFRPDTPTPDLRVAELPPTWTPTYTPTLTNTPVSTPTNTPTSTFTATPTNTEIPTETPTPTIYYLVVTGKPPTRIPTRVPTRRPPTAVPPPPPTATLIPTPQYEFILGRPVDNAPNCGTWYVSGTIYSDQAGTSRLNGILVRIWAFGIEQGTFTTKSHNGHRGYYEWIFGKNSDVQGEVAVVNPDGSLRSPKIPFAMTSKCKGSGAIQQVVIDFVGAS